MTKLKKTKKKKQPWYAWVSIGTDRHPIGVDWWKENLQNNVKRIHMKLVEVQK